MFQFQKTIRNVSTSVLIASLMWAHPAVVHAENSATIGGSVFVDMNQDGHHGGYEPGIAGVKIRLDCTTPDGKSFTKETVTNDNGWFFFYGLPPAKCKLTKLTQPEGYQDGKESVDPWIAALSGGKVGVDMITDITIGEGWEQVGYHFGELNQCGKPNSRPDCLPEPVEAGPALPTDPVTCDDYDDDWCCGMVGGSVKPQGKSNPNIFIDCSDIGDKVKPKRK